MLIAGVSEKKLLDNTCLSFEEFCVGVLADFGLRSRRINMKLL